MINRPSPALSGALLPSIVLALLVGTASADTVPRVDLDDPSLARRETPPVRARWFFLPDDPAVDPRVGAGELGLDVVGRLDRFGGAWILEADVDDAPSVESAWGALGALRRDVTGTPMLSTTTRLVGVRESVWDDLEFLGDRSSTIAILDSGLDTAHDDLGDPVDDDLDAPPAAGDAADWRDAGTTFEGDPRIRVVGWQDVTDDLPDAVGPWDYHFHGTALASAAFGGGRVEDAGRGVAPRGRVAVVKTWNFEERWEIWASDLLLGIDWVLANAARLRIHGVLIGATWPEDFGFGPAIDALNAAGIVVIAPAGNDPSQPMGYPSRMAGVFTVGATDFAGRVADYSTPSPGDQPGLALDIVAPGGSVLDAAQRVRVADNEPQDGYAFRFGTSIAAAHVAGAVSIVSEVMGATATPWRRDADQVAWVCDLLRITAVELGASEVPWPGGGPRIDRVAPDAHEGHGLLQVRAATDALREVLWPGDRRPYLIDAPTDGNAVRAARVPIVPGRPLRITLEVPDSADADLHVYRETPSGFVQLARSTRANAGADESVVVEAATEGWVVAVIRRVSGLGTTFLSADDVDAALAGWPLRFSATQRSNATYGDVDGDGTREILAVNNLALRADGHVVHVVDLRGEDVGLFPEQYFTPGFLGEFTTPSVGRWGSRTNIVTGSEFGRVFAFESNADLRWNVRVADSGETTTPAIVDVDGGPWVVVGTTDGVVGVDGDGNVVLEHPTPAVVARPVAAGDLVGDTRDEIVAVDVQGRVVALDDAGNLLTGWPRTVAAGATAPVLRGDGNGSRVQTIGIVDVDGAGVARLHRFTPGGQDVSGGPIVLDTASRVVRATSPLVCARVERGAPPRWIVSTISGGDLEPVVLRLHLIAPDGSQQVLEREYAAPRFDDAVIRFYRRRLGEPRVVELTGGGTREILVPVLVGWADERAGTELRYAVIDELVRWNLEGPVRSFVRSLPRERFPDREPLAPLIVDLDGDRIPEWVTPRDNGLSVGMGVIPADTDEGWTDSRGGIDRRACVECTAIEAVDAPAGVTVAADLRAQPNPFNPRTVLEARLAPDTPVRWRVLDARGRVVRRASSRTDADGRSAWVFDGRDARGRALASGVYHVDARGEARTLSTRIVLVR